jgi:hypothetical protein
VACTIATNGALRNRGSLDLPFPYLRKLQPASRKMGACPLRGLRSPRTSRTRDRGPERGAEAAVLGRLFLQGMYHIVFWRCTGTAQELMRRSNQEYGEGRKFNLHYKLLQNSQK